MLIRDHDQIIRNRIKLLPLVVVFFAMLLNFAGGEDVDEATAVEREGWLISEWHSTEGPYAGEITSLAQDTANSNHIYAGTPQGVYKSFDRGGTWYDIGVTDRRVHDIAVSKEDPNLVLAGAEDGIFLSRDAGATWEYVGGRLDGVAINFIDIEKDPIFGESILLGTSEGLFISRTSARSFTLVAHEGENVTAGKIYGGSPEQIYLAVEDKGLMISNNYGATWNKLSHDFVGDVLSIATSPSFPYVMYLGTTNGIYVSYDSGVSWAHIGVPGTAVYDIWMDQEVPARILAATEGEGIQKTLDGGESWEELPQDLQGKTLLAVIQDLDNPHQFFFGTGDRGVLSYNLDTQDYRVTRDGLSTAISELYTSSMDANTVMAVSGEGVYLTRNGGSDWQQVMAQRPRAVDIWYDEENEREIIYLVQDNVLLVYDNWEMSEVSEISLEGFEREITQLQAHPHDNSELWVGTDDGVFVSENSGSSWHQVGLRGAFIEYLEISHDPDSSLTAVYAGGYPGLYRYYEYDEAVADIEDVDTEDTEEAEQVTESESGALLEEWREDYGPPGEFSQITDQEEFALAEMQGVPGFPGKLWIGTLGQGLYYSEDAGESFESRHKGLPGSETDEQYFSEIRGIDIKPGAPQKMVAATGAGVFKTGDAGLNWQAIDGLQAYPESLAVHYGPPTALYLGSDEGVFYHEAFEIPYLGWEKNTSYDLANPETYQLQEEFELSNPTGETIEDVVFLAPAVINHGTYQFHYDSDFDPNPDEVITYQDYLDGVESVASLDVDENWFAMGNVILKYTRDELEPGEVWEITVDNQVVVFEVDYHLDEMAPAPYDTESEIYQLYTAPDEVSPANHPELVERAEEITAGVEGPENKARAIFNWVKDYLEYEPPGNIGALEAYRSGAGVCADYADLFVALARAEEIPARRLSGYYVSGPEEGQFHAWAEFYLEGYGWIPVEPTFEAWDSDYFGELPKPSHIFMSYGLVQHEFTTGLEFSETFNIHTVPMAEMGFQKEDLLHLMESNPFSPEDEIELREEQEQEDEESEEKASEAKEEEKEVDGESAEEQEKDEGKDLDGSESTDEEDEVKEDEKEESEQEADQTGVKETEGADDEENKESEE